MDELKELEFQRETNEYFIKRKAMVQRLQENPDFQKLIVEDFCEKECAGYAKASGDPSLSKEDRESAMQMAQAAGHLQRFLSICIRMGMTAEGQLKEIDTMIEEVRNNND